MAGAVVMTETAWIVTGVIVIAVVVALAAEKRSAHTGTLIRFSTKPILLVPRQLAGGRWYVEATWVDGRIQHISEFETEGEARRWINDKSEAYDWINHKSEAYFTGMGDPDVAGP
jgi:hypothetical protein